MLDSPTLICKIIPHSLSPCATLVLQRGLILHTHISTVSPGAKPSVYTLLFKSCIRVYARAVVEYNTASRLDIRYTHP
jgi:hypothetical protein